MAEQGSAAQPARQVGPIKKEIGEIIDHVQKLSAQVARRAYEIFEQNGRKMGLDLASMGAQLPLAGDEVLAPAGDGHLPGWRLSEIDWRARRL